MNKTMLTCRKCEQDKDAEVDFPPHLRARRMCRSCYAEDVAVRRGRDDAAKRLLFNLKHFLRLHGRPEGTLWRLSHVQDLLHEMELPEVVQEGIKLGMQPKLRIVQKDKSLPFFPHNAKVKLMCGR
jgi:hypothetical protein